MSTIFNTHKKVLLIILDGLGISQDDYKNAVKNAQTKNLDRLFQHFPSTTIEAGGEAVGLPQGICGNSEVGHMNLGAGRAIRQDLVRINEAISNQSLQYLTPFKNLIAHARKGTRRIHLMGLLSDGGVHSHIGHLKKIITYLNSHGNGQLDIFFHAFMDGRDTPFDSGATYLGDILSLEGVTLASLQGRSIAMDRDRRWDKIQLAYDTLTGRGTITALAPLDYLNNQYAESIYDEFITPVLFHRDFAVKNDDSIFFINYRPDRAIQLTSAFNIPTFNEFKVPIRPSHFLCMTPYIQEEMQLPVLFDKEKVTGGLSEYLSQQGLKQFKIAETEKYAHVTYFYNGGEKRPFPGEEHVLIPSPRDIKTYDERPEMSAYLVTEKLITALLSDQFDYYLVNFANSDMVGHTGNYTAAVKAVEVLDECVGKLMTVCREKKITLLLTADHGNSDQMVYPEGGAHTSHTNAKVPFALFDKKFEDKDFTIAHDNLALKDVAPTILSVLGIKTPQSFTGTSIFK